MSTMNCLLNVNLFIMLFVNGVVLSKGIVKISLLDLFDFSAQSYTFIFSLSHKFKRILLLQSSLFPRNCRVFVD